MKKQIAIIIISLLAALPATAHQTNNHNEKMCIRPETQNLCTPGECDFTLSCDGYWTDFCFNMFQNPCDSWNQMHEKPIAPGRPHKPVIPETPEEPETPVVPDTPEVPDVPETPETPDVPETPETPDVPETPVVPETPEIDGSEDAAPSEQEIAELFRLVNSERVKNGIAALTYDNQLEECADVRAAEIRTLFSHTRPNGLSCFSVLDDYGYSYSYAGENIAYGQKDADEVFTAWMNSEGHRENILSPFFTRIGMGLYGDGTLYWSQLFASK